jgi:hypothetical protein
MCLHTNPEQHGVEVQTALSFTHVSGDGLEIAGVGEGGGGLDIVEAVGGGGLLEAGVGGGGLLEAGIGGEGSPPPPVPRVILFPLASRKAHPH